MVEIPTVEAVPGSCVKSSDNGYYGHSSPASLDRSQVEKKKRKKIGDSSGGICDQGKRSKSAAGVPGGGGV